MRKIIFHICLLLCFVQTGLGQNKSVDSLRVSFDQSYGLDALLTNGRKYFPDSNPVVGHPFWKREEAFLGNITISGRQFTNQQLKYDLHKQLFVLFYSNYNGQPGQIILNNSVIDSVSLGNCLFIPNKNPNIRLPFVQLIYQGKLSCIIAWNKDLNFNSIGQTIGYEYAKDNFSSYLTYKGSDYRFKTKSSFLRIFNRKERVAIRKYLSSSWIKFKKMNDQDLRKLIIFCEQNLN